MSLAERVKQKRTELNLTQTQAAELAGIKQQSWASIEDGKTLKPRNIVGIAYALKCDPSWLMNGGPFQPVTQVNTRKIPLISYVQAGALASKHPIEAFDGSFEYVMTDMDWSEFTFALKIEGDSMEPDFKAGDVIIVDPEIEPAPGEFVVASNGDHEATFKKYRPTITDIDGNQHFELVPLNNDYPVINCRDRPIKILGTMVEHRIYRRKR
ncbi:helix-turn-helix domain-containing protein [Salmonella enterica]|uniref:helix-turn-helix domain-containing protein n=1 Tax=Salmonella enterica TaxID=28901 RepID=UPI0009AFCE5C|nr:S24 family peptidase [Salmonella enterica]ECJ1503096.1 helix-turn-helix domain-containing protein [Salmonella enterica subsp. enterica serovar Orion]EDT1620329.1 helix-turn-helix domain-containing protein [Salmonella enterica subsp. enterica serovar Aberdeen]HAU6706536.1 helix-turn-helix domain-containing protein [Salmonella enterica subsp. enterica serovar Chingola]AXD18430.1 helix-turn-helix domain-containing protein [Salmonella enterica]EAU4235134.1 helix-turn-helix domain-containing pro